MTSTLPLNAREKWETPRDQNFLGAATPMTGRTVEIREYLANHGPSTSTEIAQYFGIGNNVVSQAMARLLTYCSVRKIADAKNGPNGYGITYALRCHPSNHP